MDVQRNEDTAGLMAMPHRPPGSASPTRTTASVKASSLVGGAAAGGLLATFDAIFRQTLSDPPTPLASPPPAPPSGRRGAPDGAAPKRLESRPVPSDDEQEREDTGREAAEPVAVGSHPRPATADERSSDTAATTKADVAALESGSAPTDESDSDEEAELEPLGEPSAERDAPAPEAAGDAAAEPAPSHLSEDASEHESAAVATEPATPTNPTAPPLSQTAETASPQAAATVTAGTPRATEVAAGNGAGEGAARSVEHSDSVAGQPSNAAPPLEAETSSAGMESGEPANLEQGDPLIEEPQVTHESRESSDARDQDSRDQDSRDHDSRNHDPNPQRERNETGQEQARGERRAAESASRTRAINDLVAEMQPLVSPLEAAAPAAQGAQPAPLSGTAAAVAASPTAPSAAGIQSDGGDASPTSGDRVSLEGSEPRRSVGSVQGDSNEGRVQNSSNADRVRLVQRVARAFQRLGPDGGRVQVMLHPAELGSVRLDLRIDGNRMDARMTAESETARSVLREHLPELRQRLADSGLVVERIDIELDVRTSGERASAEGDRRGGQGGDEDPSWQRGPRMSSSLRQPTPATPAVPLPPNSRSAAFGTRSSLDLIA